MVRRMGRQYAFRKKRLNNSERGLHNLLSQLHIIRESPDDFYTRDFNQLFKAKS